MNFNLYFKGKMTKSEKKRLKGLRLRARISQLGVEVYRMHWNLINLFASSAVFARGGQAPSSSIAPARELKSLGVSPALRHYSL